MIKMDIYCFVFIEFKNSEKHGKLLITLQKLLKNDYRYY